MTRTDVVALLLDAFARDVCAQMLGRFVAIADHPFPGVAAGEAAAVGRWWIQECSAATDGDAVMLHLGGPGWSWVDDGAWGYNLRRYIYFAVRSDVMGRVDAGYDSRSHVASLWFSPLDNPRIFGAGVGNIETSADLLGAAFEIVTLGIAGSMADSKARDRVDAEVSLRFAERMRAGFTVTYDLSRHQIDLLLQPLATGEMPSRPFKDGTPWLTNERQLVRAAPGGYHIIGPFERAASAALDIVVESGSGVEYRAECASDVTQWFAPVSTGAYPRLPISSNGQTGTAGAGTPVLRFIVMPSCRWFLLTSSLAGETRLSVRVRGQPITWLVANP